MAAKIKLQGILSLSAASAALLQSVISTKGGGIPIESNSAMNGQMISKTDRVILEPPHQKELLRLYAAHSSHSSHASHSSHVSGVGHSSHYSATTPSPTIPDTTPSAPANPTYTPPRTVVPRQTIKSVVETNSLGKTDTLTATNQVAATNTAGITILSKNDYIDFLKKDAAKGSSSSQYTLALYYIHGESGCETNVEKAKILLELSAVQGNDAAKKRLEKLEEDQKSEIKK